MASPERIRKQCYELTPADFTNDPIWEFCPDEEAQDGQDEATVRPSEEVEVVGYQDGVFLVACDAVMADGTSMDGYIYSGKADDLGCIQPNVIGASGQVGFWMGSLRFIKDPEQRTAKLYAILAKDHASIFPIRFQTRKPINGALMEVMVPGFVGRGDGNSVVVLPVSTWGGIT